MTTRTLDEVLDNELKLIKENFALKADYEAIDKENVYIQQKREQAEKERDALAAENEKLKLQVGMLTADERTKFVCRQFYELNDTDKAKIMEFMKAVTVLREASNER